MSDLDESNQQFIAAWQFFARRAEQGTVEADRGGVSVAFSNVTAPILNMAFLATPVATAADLQARIDRAMATGAASGRMWMLTVCEDWLPADVRERAPAMMAAVGLAPTNVTTGMVTDALASPRRPVPSELTIRPADSAAGYRAVADLNMGAYHMPLEWGHEALARQELFVDGVWADVAYLGDVPVSTSTTVLIDKRLYVMLVATDAGHTNKGYAEAVMRASLARASAATKLHRTVLHATPAGAPLYTAMGYRATSQFTMYMQPPPG